MQNLCSGPYVHLQVKGPQDWIESQQSSTTMTSPQVQNTSRHSGNNGVAANVVAGVPQIAISLELWWFSIPCLASANSVTPYLVDVIVREKLTTEELRSRYVMPCTFSIIMQQNRTLRETLSKARSNAVVCVVVLSLYTPPASWTSQMLTLFWMQGPPLAKELAFPDNSAVRP